MILRDLANVFQDTSKPLHGFVIVGVVQHILSRVAKQTQRVSKHHRVFRQPLDLVGSILHYTRQRLIRPELPQTISDVLHHPFLAGNRQQAS